MDLIDAHVLSSCMDKIKSLEVELQGVRREILLLDNYRQCARKASDIEQSLFDLRVTISHLMEQTKKKSTPQMVGMFVIS